MKINDLLESFDKNYESDAPEKVAKILSRKCSQFVKAYQKTDFEKVIYRGMKDMHQLNGLVYGRIRKDRKPLHMPENAHNIISDVMEEMGLASRRNSLFCSASKIIAGQRGGDMYLRNEPYILFVVDGWNGTVFEKVKSLYAFTELLSVFEEDEGLSASDDELRILVKEKIKELKPIKFESTSGLENILKEGYQDILVTGISYYGLQKGSHLADEVVKILRAG